MKADSKFICSGILIFIITHFFNYTILWVLSIVFLLISFFLLGGVQKAG